MSVASPDLLSRHDTRLLDNAAWHALTGPHARFAEVRGVARRYGIAYAPYGALPDQRDPEAWHDLATLVGPGTELALSGASVVPPPSWTVTRSGRAFQLVAGDLTGAQDPEAVELGRDDVDEITDLIARTQPGPWRPRTVELGRYLGIRRGGRLVAMAGERVHPPGWTEISAVCTDEAFRGRGLASRLVSAVVDGVRRRGDEPFLHVSQTNATAIRVYEQLGFRLRRETTFVRLVAPER